MKQDDLWQLELDSDRFRRICQFLNRTTLQPGATLHYDVMSGGYRFSDESPGNSLQDFDEALLLPLTSLLRYLWAYRLSVLRGSPRAELAEWWDSAKELAPNWPGFAPERCSENGMQFAKFCEARQLDWEAGIEALERQFQNRDLPAPKFKHFERVVVVRQESNCQEWKGQQGTIVSIDSSYVRRQPGDPDKWLYIVYLPADNSWRTFFQIGLESEGSCDPESAHLGCRPEISFDALLEENNEWVEGSYRLPGEFWKVVIFKKDDVSKRQCEPSRWPKPTKWERETTGVVIRFPRTATMSRDDLLGAMSNVFGYADWAQVQGPDSMVLR